MKSYVSIFIKFALLSAIACGIAVLPYPEVGQGLFFLAALVYFSTRLFRLRDDRSRFISVFIFFMLIIAVIAGIGSTVLRQREITLFPLVFLLYAGAPFSLRPLPPLLFSVSTALCLVGATHGMYHWAAGFLVMERFLPTELFYLAAAALIHREGLKAAEEAEAIRQGPYDYPLRKKRLFHTPLRSIIFIVLLLGAAAVVTDAVITPARAIKHFAQFLEMRAVKAEREISRMESYLRELEIREPQSLEKDVGTAEAHNAWWKKLLQEAEKDGLVIVSDAFYTGPAKKTVIRMNDFGGSLRKTRYQLVLEGKAQDALQFMEKHAESPGMGAVSYFRMTNKGADLVTLNIEWQAIMYVGNTTGDFTGKTSAASGVERKITKPKHYIKAAEHPFSGSRLTGIYAGDEEWTFSHWDNRIQQAEFTLRKLGEKAAKARKIRRKLETAERFRHILEFVAEKHPEALGRYGKEYMEAMHRRISAILEADSDQPRVFRRLETKGNQTVELLVAANGETFQREDGFEARMNAVGPSDQSLPLKPYHTLLIKGVSMKKKSAVPVVSELVTPVESPLKLLEKDGEKRKWRILHTENSHGDQDP